MCSSDLHHGCNPHGGPPPASDHPSGLLPDLLGLSLDRTGDTGRRAAVRHHGRVPEPSFPAPPDPSHPDLVRVPCGPVTRFAPAPTGDLHLGHLVNALYTWGIARATGGRVILRIEDHDRQRSRATFEAGLLDDLERLGLTPDEPPITAFRAGPTPYRQSDCGPTYAAAAERLRVAGLVYACRCSRATFAAWEAAHGVPWDGPDRKSTRLNSSH